MLRVAVAVAAAELVHVGHKDAAIRTLHEALTSRRFRTTWQKSLEDIAKRYIDLCAEKRRAKEAKDGLYQYRGICQSANSASLEEVIRHFLNGSENRARSARARATEENAAAAAAAAASPVPLTPEALFLNSVSGETSAERRDRSLVTPWLKYLWESYRTVLDILKNNQKLEQLYQVRLSLSPLPLFLLIAYTSLSLSLSLSLAYTGNCFACFGLLLAIRAQDRLPSPDRDAPQPRR